MSLIVDRAGFLTSVQDLGRAGVGHTWAYLPDVACTIVALLSCRATLEPFARFHMSGHWDADGSQMAAAVRGVVTRHTGVAPKLRRFQWWLLTVASPWPSTGLVRTS